MPNDDFPVPSLPAPIDSGDATLTRVFPRPHDWLRLDRACPCDPRVAGSRCVHAHDAALRGM